MYIHEFQDWSRFDWNRERLAEPLAAVRHRQGRLTGHVEALGFNLRQEAVLQTLTADVLKSSEIEGEKLDACSQDTALRDILPLVERGILVRNPEGGGAPAMHLRGFPRRRGLNICSADNTAELGQCHA